MTDHGEVAYRAPLDAIRVSVLWKADVYRTAAERDERSRDALSMQDVADIFDDDLGGGARRRGSTSRGSTTPDSRRSWRTCTPRRSGRRDAFRLRRAGLSGSNPVVGCGGPR